MKYCLLVILLLAPLSPRAAHLNDLQFLPDQGTIVSTLGYGVRDDHYAVKVHAPGDQLNNFYRVEQDTSYLSIGGGYSFPHQIFLRVQTSYYYEDQSITTYESGATIAGAEFKRNHKGLTDPTITFKYRVSDSLTSADFIFDVSGSISPSTGKRKYASTTEDGNEKRGGTNYSIVMDIGKLDVGLRAYTLFVNAKRFGRTGGIDLLDNSSVTTSAHKSLGGGAKFKTLSSEYFYFELALEYGYLTDYTLENLGNNTTVDQKNYLDILVGVDYEIKKDVIIWRSILNSYQSKYHTKTSTLNMDNDAGSLSYMTSLIYQY